MPLVRIDLIEGRLGHSDMGWRSISYTQRAVEVSPKPMIRVCPA